MHEVQIQQSPQNRRQTLYSYSAIPSGRSITVKGALSMVAVFALLAGYYRSYPSDAFKFGRICGQPSTPSYTGRHTPKWYSCNNVSIPQMFSTVHKPEDRCPVKENNLMSK